MTLQQLRYVVEVAKQKSMNKAAAELFISQPSLSNAIKDLEKEIHNNIIDMAIVLGDIVISLEKVKEQSKEYGHSFKRELIYLVTHSMFHLLGYDHMQEEDKKIMREKEDIVMNILNIIYYIKYLKA